MNITNKTVLITGGGDQPMSEGIAYMQEPDRNPWRIIDQGKEFVPDVFYKGHQFIKGQIKLKYEISYKGFTVLVDVNYPEYKINSVLFFAV